MLSACHLITCYHAQSNQYLSCTSHYSYEPLVHVSAVSMQAWVHADHVGYNWYLHSPAASTLHSNSCLSRCLFCHHPTHFNCFLIAQQLWPSSITKLQANITSGPYRSHQLSSISSLPLSA